MATRLILAPAGYEERAALAASCLPGPDAHRAGLLRCTPAMVARTRNRSAAFVDAARLALAVGVPFALLVSGPTETLEAALRERWGEPEEVRKGRRPRVSA